MRKVDIKDFEDYQITDDGSVWSKKRNKWMILQTNKKNGYSYVGLMKNGKRHLKSIHRLVAEAQSKKVYQYTLDGELVKIWKSAMDCGRNGYSQGNVSACCRGERGTHKNYIWKYE